MHHVVIVGAGFGGLGAAHGKEVTTLLGVVTGVDTENRTVLLEDGGGVTYDTLILATGAQHAYFGHDEWEPYAPGLKTLEDATSIRRRILLSFERAERETDPQRRAALLTFVIVGGGPTGVELAGAIAELARENLPEDFRHIDTRKDTAPRPFRYMHAGNLATIGKRAAVIDFGWIKVRGWIAWWIWGSAHIYFLIGVRNRLAVALSWLWIYVTGNRSACLITQGEQRPKSP